MRVVMARPALPPAARAPCDPPVAVSDRELSERDVATLWSRDRAALKTCEARRAAAVSAVDAVKEGPN